MNIIISAVHLCWLPGLLIFGLTSEAEAVRASYSNGFNGTLLHHQVRHLIRQYSDGQSHVSKQNENILSQIKRLTGVLERHLNRSATEPAGGTTVSIQSERPHLRGRSISRVMNRFRNEQKAYLRDTRRTLLFRYRINRIRKHDRMLKQRLKRLRRRITALRKQTRLAQARRASLKRLQKMLRASRRASGKVKEARSSVRLQLARHTLWIRALEVQRAALRHRVRRLFRRRQTLGRRIGVLNERTQVQLSDIVERHRFLITSLKRWKIFSVKRMAKFSKKDDPASSRRPLELKSREDVWRYSALVYHHMKDFRRIAKAALKFKRKLAKIDEKLAKLRLSSVKQQVSNSSVTNNLAEQIKKLDVDKNQELTKQRERKEALHKVAKSFSTLSSRLGLHDNVKLLQRPPKQRVAGNAANFKEMFKRRIENRFEHFEFQLRHETQRVELLKRREIHLQHRRVRLRRRLVRLRARRRRFERRIDALEIRRRRLLRRIKEAAKMSKKKQQATMKGITTSADRVASLRRRFHRLVRRIRGTAAKWRRLEARAVAARCRVRRQKRRLRRLKIRRRRFLRRLRRQGLSKLTD
ncbi:hypothetical protein BOX15_Mlig032363g1 [Macrostomum lignano]|uniref:Uncharacterized protein n=1 Tax=Macrostomum lignano TaxID=282301 RepID=A0A267EAW3_9PLAT|nr:hypothetical protein BOX15_Mlig032363g1 [Macrostomum lignano]